MPKGIPGVQIKGVLFDFDGTLTRPGALDFPAIKRQLGCPPDQAILEFLESCSRTERSALMTVLERCEAAAARASVPNGGAEACLVALKQRGVRLGILTRNGRSSVFTALKGFQRIAAEDFDVIVTREECLPKPHPDGVLQGAAGMGLVPPQLLVVGDFRFDVMAGEAAGATTVLLTNGGPSVMRPEDPQPDHVVDSLQELPGLFFPSEKRQG